MEIDNATRMATAFTVGLDPDGRERLVVVVKGTFTFREDGGPLSPADEQVALTLADQHEGDPGRSAVRYETDFAPTKPKCDVIVNGSAYAPGGRPVAAVRTTVAVAGGFEKTVDVYGDRCWTRRGLLGIETTPPSPFERLPISYGRAFGGVDADPDVPDRLEVCRSNPVGVGFYPLSRRKSLFGKPLPNTGEPGRIMVDPDQLDQRPMAYGPLGRDFSDRTTLAGTYDQHWLDEHHPFLPPDFSPLFYQSAPANQQIDYPKGGEVVVLEALTPSGRAVFALPDLFLPIEFTTTELEHHDVPAQVDTIVVEPDERRVTLVWRASRPLRRNVFEVERVTVGLKTPGFYRARDTGKQFYPSLRALGAAKQAAIEPLLDEPEGEESPP